MCCIPYAGCPFQKPCPVLFAVQLAVWRHMVRTCGMPPMSVKALMATDAASFVVNLDTAVCVPDIHFFTDVLIRDRLILEIYGDIIVQLNRGCFLLGKTHMGSWEVEARNGFLFPGTQCTSYNSLRWPVAFATLANAFLYTPRVLAMRR